MIENAIDKEKSSIKGSYKGQWGKMVYIYITFNNKDTFLKKRKFQREPIFLLKVNFWPNFLCEILSVEVS